MGIFGVNMPMLYGEGEQKAFLRLQGEIAKGNSDHTIFLWNVPEPREPIGMLTADLSNFCNATPCERCDRQTFLSPNARHWIPQKPNQPVQSFDSLSSSPLGVHLTAKLITLADFPCGEHIKAAELPEAATHLVVLNVRVTSGYIWIPLVRSNDFYNIVDRNDQERSHLCAPTFGEITI